MTIRTRDEDLKVLSVIMEVRYLEGFRYLDHSGEIIIGVQKQEPRWVLQTIRQQGVSFLHNEHKLLLNIGVDKIDLSRIRPVSFADVEKVSRQIGQEADPVYQHTIQTLKCTKTLRVGVRCIFLLHPAFLKTPSKA